MSDPRDPLDSGGSASRAPLDCPDPSTIRLKDPVWLVLARGWTVGYLAITGMLSIMATVMMLGMNEDGALLVPAGALTLLSVWLFLRRRSFGAMLRVLHGLYAPLVGLLLVVPADYHLDGAPGRLLVAAALIGAFALGVALVRPPRSRAGGWALLSAHAVGLTAASLGAILAALFLWPIAWANGSFLFSSRGDLVQSIAEIVLRVSLLVPLTFPFAFMMGFGPGLLLVHLLAWRDAARSLAGGRWVAGPLLASGAVIVALASAYFWLATGDRSALEGLLARPPASDAERHAILARSPELRRLLLEADWARRTRKQGLDLGWSWRTIIGEEAVLGLQRHHDLLFAPLQSRAADLPTWLRGEEVGKLYAEVFDAPIERSGGGASWRNAGARLDAVGAERVYLAAQSLTVTEHGQAASIELFEAYESRSGWQEEVRYELALPPTAVVTGLWLGETPDRAAALPARISPRGAAQRVYEAEVQRWVDPALLEQVGPRQYRLRAYPVPPNGKLYVWVRFSVLARGDRWPLPRLLEARNAFWDVSTRRQIDGESVPGHAAWLPPSLPIARPAPRTPFSVVFPGGVAIRGEPVESASFGRPGGGRRYAVVVDRSRSMEARRAAVRDAFETLTSLAREDEVDVYLTASAWRGEPARRARLGEVEPERLLFFGAQSLSGIIADFEALSGDSAYDAVLVLTDGGTYDHEPRSSRKFAPRAPLWIVHLDGELAPAYADGVLEAVRASGGGVAERVSEVLGHLAALEARAGAFIAVADDWAFTFERAEADVGPPEAPTALEQIAAHQLLAGAMQLGSQLDLLHDVARSYRIVSPYSSMIVLVNERQHAALDAAEARDDRFEREVNTGGDQARFGALIGTPEPGTWTALTLAALGLAWVRRRRHRAETSSR